MKGTTAVAYGTKFNLLDLTISVSVKMDDNVIPDEAGPSVTMDKIQGEKQWFPDITSLFGLNDSLLEEFPRHMALLTIGSQNAFLRMGPGAEGEPEPIGTGEGVIICTEKAVIGASSQTSFLSENQFAFHVRIPYENITSVLGSPGPSGMIDISTGGEVIRFNIAKSANDRCVRDVYGYIIDNI